MSIAEREPDLEEVFDHSLPPDQDAPLAAGEEAAPEARSGLFEWIRGTTGGGNPYPLAVLSLLFLIDEFDTTTFAINSPEIQQHFDLSDDTFGLLVAVNAVVVLMLAIPLGFVGDRLRRVRIALLGATIAGLSTVSTGIAPVVGLLVVARLTNGAGRLANTSIHNSLLSDYYAPVTRPRVLGFHRNAEFLGTIAGYAITGLLGQLLGWRLTFVLIGIPTTLVVLLAARLREPKRGATDDPEAAVLAEASDALGFMASVRTLTSVKTLKRQYVAWVFIGAGAVPLAIYLPRLQERVFGLSVFERGLIGAVNAGVTFVGVTVSSRWTQGWFAKGMGEPLRRAGLCLAVVGIGLLGVAVTPLWLNIPVGLVASFAIGCFYPPLLATQAFTSPAEVRTLSFSFGALFLGLGGIGFLVLIAIVGSGDSVRGSIAATVPFWLIGGAVLASARTYVAGDAAKAMRAMSTRIEQRRRRDDAKERSMLVCAGVDAGYDAVQVLFEVDLDVAEGEIVALLGTNGAGKSTLLKAISGLLDPSGGLILFDGVDVTHMNPIERAKLGIVQMPGGRSVFPTLTVDECLRLAGWLHKGDPEHVKRATDTALEYFPVLRQRGGQLAGNLSGGEQQMLGLAMAFISKPRLLMIDELSLGLAPTVVSQLVEIVQAIHAGGTTIIVVEQSVNVALLLAQRAVFMEKGEVRFSGPTAELLERDDILRSVFLQGAAAHTGSADGEAARTKERLELPPLEADAPVVLELDDVSVSFGGVRAVNGTSLTLRQGEILGLIGPNGAGKTTLFDLISGFVAPTAGRIVFAGEDITSMSPDRRARLGLGRSFQDARIFPSLTVAENLAVSLERHLEVRDPIAASLGLPAVLETELAVKERVEQLIDLLGLRAFANKFVGELSTGSRRIVDLGMSIAHHPSVLLLDEPSSGIAQRETEALGPLLLRIQQELGCSLLVIEHDMPLITGVSHTMMALELGTPIVSGTPAEVVEHPRVVASYLGTNEQVVNRSGDLAHAVEDVFAELHADDAAPAPRRKRQPRVVRPKAGAPDR